MNSSYIKAMYKLQAAKSDIERLFHEGQQLQDTFEERQISNLLENIVESMDMAASKIERFTMPAIEGYLKENKDNEKFELIQTNTGESLGWQFSCGSYLEVYDTDTEEWYSGRVEHTTKDGQTGYYFYNHDIDNPFLYTGMKARIRKNISFCT